MMLVWERWKDIDRLKEEFWTFKIGDRHDDVIFMLMVIPEERVLELEPFLRDWLLKRRAG